MIFELITFRIKPGEGKKFETFNERFREVLSRVDGFISHQMCRSESDPNLYIIGLAWLNKNSRFIFEKHSTPNYKSLFQEGGDFFQEKPVHQIFTILDTRFLEK